MSFKETIAASEELSLSLSLPLSYSDDTRSVRNGSRHERLKCQVFFQFFFCSFQFANYNGKYCFPTEVAAASKGDSNIARFPHQSE